MSDRLQPGQSAPDFSLPADDGGTWSLADHRGHSVVVYFYPAAATPGCTTEACDFRDSLSSLQGAGFDVVGVSPDPPEALAAFKAAEGLTFPLLSDPERTVLQAYGAWGEKNLYGKAVTGVVRSTFVVDPDGALRTAQYDVKATGHVKRLRAELGVD